MAIDLLALSMSQLQLDMTDMLSCVSRVFTIQTVTSGKPPILFLLQHMSEFLKKTQNHSPNTCQFAILAREIFDL